MVFVVFLKGTYYVDDAGARRPGDCLGHRREERWSTVKAGSTPADIFSDRLIITGVERDGQPITRQK